MAPTGPVPATRVRELVARVLDDVLGADDPAYHVDLEVGLDLHVILVRIRFPADQLSAYVEPRATDAEIMVRIAESILNDVSETSFAWGDARPACPVAGHRHLPVAEAVDGVASWLCPDDPGARRPIGGQVPPPVPSPPA